MAICDRKVLTTVEQIYINFYKIDNNSNVPTILSPVYVVQFSSPFIKKVHSDKNQSIHLLLFTDCQPLQS